jgi:hypothetical protein
MCRWWPAVHVWMFITLWRTCSSLCDEKDCFLKNVLKKCKSSTSSILQVDRITVCRPSVSSFNRTCLKISTQRITLWGKLGAEGHVWTTLHPFDRLQAFTQFHSFRRRANSSSWWSRSSLKGLRLEHWANLLGASKTHLIQRCLPRVAQISAGVRALV